MTRRSTWEALIPWKHLLNEKHKPDLQHTLTSPASDGESGACADPSEPVLGPHSQRQAAHRSLWLQDLLHRWLLLLVVASQGAHLACKTSGWLF